MVQLLGGRFPLGCSVGIEQRKALPCDFSGTRSSCLEVGLCCCASRVGTYLWDLYPFQLCLIWTIYQKITPSREVAPNPFLRIRGVAAERALGGPGTSATTAVALQGGVPPVAVSL